MKRSITIISAAAAAIVAGCVVTSVYPYYTDKDLVNEPAIAGHWLNAKHPAQSWTFSQATNAACLLTVAEDSKATVLETHAFKLRGQLFLDIYSLEADYHVIPAHYLLKVDALTPTLKTSELDQNWLEKYFADHPNSIRHKLVANNDHPEAVRIVLTDDTSELQHFILRHLNTTGAWKQGIELKQDTTMKTVELKGSP